MGPEMLQLCNTKISGDVSCWSVDQTVRGGGRGHILDLGN